MNKHKLLYLIKESGRTTDDFCTEIGMARSTFSKKCNGHSYFDVSEISKIIELLNLTAEDVMDIFFTSKVS